MDILNAWNLDLFMRLNCDAASAPLLIAIAHFLAIRLVYLVPAGLVCAVVWGRPEMKRQAFLAFAAIVAVLGFNYLIGVIWPQPRPFVLGMGCTPLPHAPTPSFPSNHAGIFWTAGLTLVVFGRYRMAGWCVVALGAMTAWARVYLGVHFPLDMAGALVLSCLVCFALRAVLHRLAQAGRWR